MLWGHWQRVLLSSSSVGKYLKLSKSNHYLQSAESYSSYIVLVTYTSAQLVCFEFLKFSIDIADLVVILNRGTYYTVLFI
jgi:hypothetical protein